MPYGDLIFGLLFFAVFAVYLYFGLRVIHDDPEGAPNKVFFALCVCGCLWAFGLSLANCAPTRSASQMWWRVSALGSCTFFGFLPHFPLALRAQGFTSLGRKAAYVLHAPALWCLWRYSISSKSAETVYDLVQTPYGWLNAAGVHGSSSLFVLYRGLCILGAICVMWLLLRRTREPLLLRRLKIALRLLLAGGCLSVLTDVLPVLYPPYSLPHMTPIFMVAPVAAMYYASGYGKGKDIAKDSLILSQQTRHKLQFYLGCTYVSGGILVFANQYFPNFSVNKDWLVRTTQTGVMLFLLGLVILAVQRLKDRKIADALTLGMLLFSIPLITLRFVQSGGVTVWAFPFVMILVSLMYDGRVPLFLVTVVSVLTQLVLWAMSPKSLVLVDEFDHVLRMGMYLIAFWVGSFVNTTYVYRLKENIRKVKSQQLISQVSFSFVGINSENMGDVIEGMLASLGRFFRVDEVCLSLSGRFEEGEPPVYRWPEERGMKESGSSEGAKLPPWCEERLNWGEGIFVDDIGALQESENPHDDKTLSFALFPVLENKQLLGYLSLAAGEPKLWSAEDKALLGILGNLLSDGLIRVRAEREIEHMAYYDSLTGLPNRHLFSDQLKHAIKGAGPGEGIVVLFVDLDSFKVLNDTMGHDKGDIVLRDIGAGLAKAVGPEGVAARFGGDEFLIMVRGPSYAYGIEKVVAQEVMGLFEQPFSVDNREFFVTASVGGAVYPFDGEDAVTLIKNADIAMYAAKTRGKNQFAMCTRHMKDDVQKNIHLSNDLYRVLEKRELEVHYQPQIKTATGGIIGLEALLRWNHPQRGSIPPSLFIPLAEANGTITSVGKWVLETAIRQNKRWQIMGRPDLRMAVNLSVVQLNDPGLVLSVSRILKEQDMDPKYLEIEITESAATKESGRIMETLYGLKSLGVTISIDDFGTEYSSLSRLKVLPVDRIKIDMQFVQSIERSEKDQAIVKVIISLAKSLGLGVLAEGVETAPQLDFLNRKMCDEVQGYYYYKPMPADEVEQLLFPVWPQKKQQPRMCAKPQPLCS